MLQPLLCAPGICKVDSAYAAGKEVGYSTVGIERGRYTDANHIRFVAGFPEKIGGAVSLLSVSLLGVPYSLVEWRDLASNIWTAIGTTVKLYVFDGATVTDITPLRALLTGNLTNPLSTTNGSNSVSVAHTGHGQQVGDYIELVAGSTIGGLTIAGFYFIATVPNANSYTFLAATNAISTVSGGGGTVAYQYFRNTLSGALTTTSGSAVVKITYAGHGETTGSYVDIAGASAFNGITLSGTYAVTVVDTNNFTVIAANNANASSTGGGTFTIESEVLITPVGLSSAGTSWGGGDYGGGSYGGGGSSTITVGDLWFLSPYGQNLFAGLQFGTIYVWNPSQGGRAYPLYNAPTSILAMFITHERFPIALGTNGNPLQYAWPDQNDPTIWTSAVTNTAETGRAIQGGNYLVAGLNVRDGVSMIFSDGVAYTLTYTGDTFVYATATASSDAGLIGPFAAASQEGICYWWGVSDFWTWNGSVQRMPSDDIRDFVFSNLSQTYQSKCFAVILSAKKEVWFFYPSLGAVECDSYVIYHTDQGCWSIGTWQRTCWYDRQLITTPIACDAAGNLYSQESGLDDNGIPLAISLIFSPTDVSNGTQNVDIFGAVPDFERLTNSVGLSILTKQYPLNSYMIDGPYTVSPTDPTTYRIDLRSEGKMVGFQLAAASLGMDFRLGAMRIDMQPSGYRR